MTKARLTALLALILLIGLLPTAAAQEAQTPEALCEAALPAADPETRTFEGPEQVLEPGVDYYAIFCTEAGPVYIDLFEDLAPVTVNNFVFLTEQRYYNNTNFHRVIADFMAQGGDPTNTGSGDPGYAFNDEFVGFLTFNRPGLLAMANAGPGTNGSQFFITTVPTPHLNFAHTIFGEVLSGQENVENLQLRDPASPDGPGSALNTILIITDPAKVDVEIPVSEPASPEAVVEAFTDISEELPNLADFLTMETAPAVLDTDKVVAGVSEAMQADYAAFLTEHNHEYRVTGTILAGCDLATFPAPSMTYTLDAFATAEDAAAALEDDFLAQLQVDQGLTAQESTTSPYPVYVGTTTACDQELTLARTFWQRGRFVVTAEMVFQNQDGFPPADILLSELVGMTLFEPYLGEVLLPEIR